MGHLDASFVPREEAKSPKITLEGIMSTMVIDAYEDSKVVTFNIPGVYLQKDLPKDKFMIFWMEG